MLDQAIAQLERVSWAVVHDVSPEQAPELRRTIRAAARARNWRVRSTYRPDLAMVSVVMPAPAPITTRRTALAR